MSVFDDDEYEDMSSYCDDEPVRCKNCHGTGKWGGWDKLTGPAEEEECPVCYGEGWL